MRRLERFSTTFSVPYDQATQRAGIRVFISAMDGWLVTGTPFSGTGFFAARFFGTLSYLQRFEFDLGQEILCRYSAMITRLATNDAALRSPECAGRCQRRPGVKSIKYYSAEI
jgi:hypothetical protein